MGITNVFIAGVGGQGLVLSNQVYARAALLEGLDVKTSDIYGLAMRGGSVYGYLRFGEKVLTSTFASGEGDILIALEALEGLRFAHHMRTGALAIINSSAVLPSQVLLEKATYPLDIVERLEKADLRVVSVNGLALSLKAGNPKMVNIALLGIVAQLNKRVSADAFRQAIRDTVPSRFYDANVAAFELARSSKI